MNHVNILLVFREPELSFLFVLIDWSLNLFEARFIQPFDPKLHYLLLLLQRLKQFPIKLHEIGSDIIYITEVIRGYRPAEWVIFKLTLRDLI